MVACKFSGEYVFTVKFKNKVIEIPCNEFGLLDVNNLYDQPISIYLFGCYIEEYFDFWRDMLRNYDIAKIRIDIYECDVLLGRLENVMIRSIHESKVIIDAGAYQPNILPNSRILLERIKSNVENLEIMKSKEMVLMEERLKDSIMAMRDADHIVSIKEDSLNNFIKQIPVAVNYTPIVPPIENDKIFILTPTI